MCSTARRSGCRLTTLTAPMTSLRNVTVFWCDHTGCEAWSAGRQPMWWSGRQQHFCPEHRPVCTRCDQPLRQQRETLADFPGTVRVGVGGLCETCTQSKKRAAAIPAIDTVDPKQVRYVKRKIAEWMENPDDRALIIETLGIGGDID